ncbi:PREDICTED: uncharacterized protein LOC109236459 [Nicotiana attenuata]|uniref:uncharacterized protein LOC109236459 n=1 Tax=Nicotiana attenuata TaxID=49451 RepID=UPI000905BB99|nr:PREDICTED: uncharacterized protein LOC109236459 [Nicotiana attenuata]
MIKAVSLRSGKTLAEPIGKPRAEKEINSTKIAEEQKIGESLPKEDISSRRLINRNLAVQLRKASTCSVTLSSKDEAGETRQMLWEILGDAETAMCEHVHRGASINLMPLSVFKKLEGELGVIKSVPVSLQLVDQTTIIPEGIIEDILVRVDKFVFPVDFIVVDMEVNKELVGDALERCIIQSSTTEDEDPEIKKEVEALKDENLVVDEEEFEKEKSSRSWNWKYSRHT